MLVTDLYLGVCGHWVLLGTVVTLYVRHSPSSFMLQLKACLGEAERLGAALHSGSPVLISHVELSSVIAAKTRSAKLSTSGGSAAHHLLVPSYWCILAVTIAQSVQRYIQR